MPLSIDIIQGDDVHKIVRESEFLSRWQTLAEITSHVTVFQEPPFVTCWYEQYRSAYQPILVIAYDDTGILSGLLPLAINLADRSLSHAGDQQVEYSGWLCTDEYKITFISMALATIKKQISYTRWLWSTIPPNADVTWLTSPEKGLEQIYTSYNVVNSPVLDLHNEDKLKKVLKNKSVKSKINRLKKKGDLRIERITESQRVTELIDDITNLVNFRHGAAHGDLAFNEDPYQKDFYHARGKNLVNNHFSVLWLGDKLLAFHFGGIDNDTIYIGLTAFDPTESKHSPGVIFLIFLANLMKEEGIRYIDLTPGGDEYKERFSNQHHTLYHPIFFPNKTSKLQYDSKKYIKQAIMNGLGKLGIEKNNLTAASKQGRNKANKIESALYFTNDSNIDNEITNTGIINTQKFSDLLLHKDVNNSIKMQSLLSHATQRFSKEDILFSLINENRLAGIAWMSKPSNKHKFLGYEFNTDETSVVIDLMDIIDLLEKNRLSSMLSAMIRYAHSIDIRNIYCVLPDKIDSKSRDIVSHFGFHEPVTNK